MARGTFARRSLVALTLWILVVVVGLAFLSAARAHAQASSDDTIPPTIKMLAQHATALARFYDVKSFAGAGEALLKFFDLLEEKKPEMDAGFTLLHGDLDRIYDYLEASDAAKDWRDRKRDQNERFSAAVTAVQMAEQAVLSKPPNPIPLSSPTCEASTLCSTAAATAMKDSLLAVNRAKPLEESLRHYRLPGPWKPGGARDGDRNEGQWSHVIEDSAVKELQHSYGYDWRVGIAHLMQLIALRVQVIAAFDFDFTKHRVFKNELLDHRKALLNHYQRMANGIKRGFRYYPVSLVYTDEYGQTRYEPSRVEYELYIGCADVYTGTFFMEYLQSTEVVPANSSSYIDPSTNTLIAEEVRRRHDRMCGEIMRKMPLFEMRSLIDTLFLNAHPELARVCADSVHGRIAWDYFGNTSWDERNVQMLCQGAETTTEPAKCFQEVMHGGVSWGGGTQWEWENALNLCKEAKDAVSTVSCFKDKIRAGSEWPAAIEACNSLSPFQLSRKP